MWKKYRKIWIRDVRRFLSQQIVVGLSAAFIVAVYQYKTGQLSRASVPSKVSEVVLPYAVIIAFWLLYHSVYVLYLLAKDSHPPEGSQLTLPPHYTEHRRPKFGRRWPLVGAVMLLAASLGILVSSRFKRSSPPRPPAPITNLSALR